jgi:hypothetical protein
MIMMMQKMHHPTLSDTIVREKGNFFKFESQQDVRGSAFLSFSEAMGASVWPTAFLTYFPQSS